MDASDKDIIVQGLQKIIDQMESLETNRILPDGHPNKAMPPTEAPDTSTGPSMDDNQDPMAGDGSDGDVDPGILDELMSKASSGDGEEMDGGGDLPPEIMAAVADKKKKPLV